MKVETVGSRGVGRHRTSGVMQMFVSLLCSLVKALGPSFEIVVHDFSQLPNSVVAIAGNVTGRAVGSPATDLLLRLIHEEKYEDLIGYRSELPDGRVLRSSTIFIKDLSGKATGCICINQDITNLLGARLVIDGMCRTVPLEQMADVSEYYATDPMQVLDYLVNQAVKEIGQVPALMKREQKLALVRYIEEGGGFRIKGAVRHLASTLGVSVYTLYGYINQVRERRC